MNIFKLFRTQFQWRLIAFVAPLVALPLLVVSFILLNQWRAAVIDGIDELEQTNTRRIAEQIETLIQPLAEDIQFLSTSSGIRNYAIALVSNDTIASRSLRNAVSIDFVDFARSRGVYHQLLFLSADGQALVNILFDGTNYQILVTTQNHRDRDYFTQAVGLEAGELYVSPMVLGRDFDTDAVTGTIDANSIRPELRYSTPIYFRSPITNQVELAGVIVTIARLDSILESIAPTSDDVTAMLINQDGFYLYHSDDPTRVFGFETGIGEVGGSVGANIRQEFSTEQVNLLLNESDADLTDTQLVTEGEGIVNFERIVPPGADYFWILLNQREETALIAPINAATVQTYIGLAILLIVASAITFVFARQVVRPLRRLEHAANRFASGDFNLRDEDLIQREDEFGTLSVSLNAMAAQLSGLIGSFEERLEERTRDLQTVVAVSNQISTILDANRLLQDVVDLTKERFSLYHAHIYILDEQTNFLRLTAGAGHVGRQMVSEARTIELYNIQSIVARAARSRTTIIINNVRESETFLPHPLLPDTHSELAVPLIARGRVLGVLDVQSDEVGYFTEETESVLNILATQIATALNNAQLFETADRASRHEQAIGRIQSQIQTALDMEEVLQVTVRELGKALRVPHTAIELRLRGDTTNDVDKSEPIKPETPIPTGETNE